MVYLGFSVAASIWMLCIELIKIAQRRTYLYTLTLVGTRTFSLEKMKAISWELEETGKRGGRPRRRKTDVLEIAAIFHIHRSPNNSILGLETYCWAEKIPAIIGPKKWIASSSPTIYWALPKAQAFFSLYCTDLRVYVENFVFDYICNSFKAHKFWKGHKILGNLHLTFD